MKKIFILLIGLVTIFLHSTSPAHAADSCNISLSSTEIVLGDTLTISVENAINDDNLINSAFVLGGSGDYYFEFNPSGNKSPNLLIENGVVKQDGEPGYSVGPQINGEAVTFAGYPNSPGTYKVSLKHWLGEIFNNAETICESVSFTVLEESESPETQLCTTGEPYEIDPADVFIPSDIDRANEFTGLIRAGSDFANQTIYLTIEGFLPIEINLDSTGTGSFAFMIDDRFPNLDNGTYEVWITDSYTAYNSCTEIKSLTVFGDRSCKALGETCSDTDTILPCAGYVCDPVTGIVTLSRLSTFEYVCTNVELNTCDECEVLITGERLCSNYTSNLTTCINVCDGASIAPRCNTGFSDEGIPTAFGCFDYGLITRGIQSLIVILVGMGGGVTLLLIVYAAFLIITSAGDPQRLEQGKVFLISAISGLLMVVLSVWLLRVIGIDVLGLWGV